MCMCMSSLLVGPQLPNRAHFLIRMPRRNLGTSFPATAHLVHANAEQSLMLNVRPAPIFRFQATRIPRRGTVLRRVQHASANHGTATQREAIGPTLQATVRTEAGTKTLRTRQHGNRSLPLPPLMHPIAIEAKERHKMPKAELKAEGMTGFQRALASNPFGTTNMPR